MDSLSANARRAQRMGAPASLAENAEDLNILYDVPFVIEAEMGETARTVRDVLKLTQGCLLELDKEEGDPIDLKINGHLIARGEVVELDGCYAVRITELVSK